MAAKTVKSELMLFGGHGKGFPKAMRAIAVTVATAMAWLAGPVNAFSKGRAPVTPYSRLAEKGLTQTPDAALQAKMAGKDAADAKETAAPDVRLLSKEEMKSTRGSGPYRSAYSNGSLPWQKSFRDVNLCNGNLFKSFTDIQIAPGRGAGLVLQRTYNSNDERVGPFGVGWTHAYDIRMEEAGVDPEHTEPGTDPGVDVEVVPRTDFFGGKHDYKRDADGLYSPPAYLFDELDSKYDEQLANGPSAPVEDIQKGMDGTIKHFVTNETVAPYPSLPGAPPQDLVNHKVRVCDYIEDRHGNRTNLAYDETITLPDGSTKKLLTSVTDPAGRALSFTWSNLGTSSQPTYRITQVQGPSGTYRVTYAYNSELNLQSVTLDPDGLNRTTTFGYTSCGGEDGLLATITDPLGHSISYEYGLHDTYYTPTMAWVTAIVEPAGIDASGNLRTLRWTLTNHSDMTWVAVNLPGVSSNIVVNFDYQLRAKGLFLTYTGYGGEWHTYYDKWNNPIATTVLKRKLDARSLSPSTSNQIVQEQDATYGLHGNVLTQSVYGFPGTATTHYWDASKYFQKKSVTDALGRTSTFDYYDDQDPNVGNRGEVKWVRDARYDVTGKQFEYAYNNFGQKISEKNLNDVTTAYTYGDTWGNLTQVIQDPSVPSQGYVGLNRTTQMAYDVSGRVLSSTDPMGRTSSFNYNHLGQPTAASFAATADTPGETISYGYGLNGRTQSVTDNRGTTSIAYETGGDRVASVSDPVSGTMAYTYGMLGERTSMTLPSGGSLSYQYSFLLMGSADLNQVGRALQRIVDENGRIIDVATDTAGSALAVRYNQSVDQNGTVTAYSQRNYTYQTTGWGIWSSGRLQSVQDQDVNAQNGSARLVSQNQYTYDDNGQRTSNTIGIGDAQGNVQSRVETYGYDALSRLTGVNYGDGQSQTYAFDAMGNRTTKTDNVTGGETYGFNAANMLTNRSVAGTASTYSNDANGNTLSGGGRVSTWDSQNRLVKVVKNGVTSEFTYGCDGLRRRSVVTQASGEQMRTDYVLDGQSVVQEVVTHRVNANASWGNTTTVGYLQGPSGPLYRHVSGTTDVSWYVYDGLGSVVGEVDVTGNLTSTKSHDVYGLTRSVTGNPTSRHGFVGGLGHTEDDETGFVYMRARHYDPETGRFASQDTAHDGINWFVYCDNDPVNKVDVDGKNPTPSQLFFAIMTAVLGVVGGCISLAGAFAAGGALLSLFSLAGCWAWAPALGAIATSEMIGGSIALSLCGPVGVALIVTLLVIGAICAVLATFDDVGGINEVFGYGKSEQVDNPF